MGVKCRKLLINDHKAEWPSVRLLLNFYFELKHQNTINTYLAVFKLSTIFQTDYKWLNDFGSGFVDRN